MLLINTSVWISVFRDRTDQVRQKLETLIDDRDVFLTLGLTLNIFSLRLIVFQPTSF